MRLRNRPRLQLLLAGCILLLVQSLASLRAQTFNLETNREPITSLDGLWRFHTGDNLQWASPNFDDSQWPLLHSDKDWDQQGYRAYGGYAWYRFTIETSASDKPLSLKLTGILTSYRVYADGQLLGGYGHMPPSTLIQLSRTQVFDLPRAGGGHPRTIHIAIRVWHSPIWSSYAPGGTQIPGNLAGDSVLIHRQFAILKAAYSSQESSHFAYSIVVWLFGLFALALFLLRTSDSEYLWFSLLLLASGTHAAFHIALAMTILPIQFFDLATGCLDAIFQIAGLLFFLQVLHARRSAMWWFACVAACLAPVTLFLYFFRWTSVPVSGFAEVMYLLPSQLWVLATLLRSAARKDVNARLLLFPVLLVYGFAVADDIASITFQLGWQAMGISLDIPVLHHPFYLGMKVLLFTIFVFTMMLFLVRRFSLARREEERLSGELEAARGMQSLLVPVAAPDTPGFKVESVYFPASEVGGDFFQIQPSEDGSLLIVVGDVSGKGLKAAMTVSAIVGALRDYPAREPAEILAHLNRVLHGQITGFATCCAAFISPNGQLTIANAGHLSPYRNGEEITVEGGLPLGMIAESDYEETQYQLVPGDRLTFMSDGVVEARNREGQLYGFERTRQISNQPAATIAQTAKQFGQEDDITVLRIEYAGAEISVNA